LSVLRFSFYIKRKKVVGQVGQALIINRLQALLSRAAVGQTVGQKLTRFELSESSALNLPYLCPTKQKNC